MKAWTTGANYACGGITGHADDCNRELCFKVAGNAKERRDQFMQSLRKLVEREEWQAAYDAELSDERGLTTHALEAWMIKNVLVDEESVVYLTLPDGSLMVVDSVRVDSQDNLLFTVRPLTEIGKES